MAKERRVKGGMYVFVENEQWIQSRHHVIPTENGWSVETVWTAGVDVYKSLLPLVEILRCFVLDEAQLLALMSLEQHLITEIGESDRKAEDEHERQRMFRDARGQTGDDAPF